MLTAGIDRARRRHDERRRDADALRQAITETVVAAVQLRDGVLLFRRIMTPRRLALGGVATGADWAGTVLSAAEAAPPVWALLAAAVRDLLRTGGILDQRQFAAGERYQQIVTPQLQRLTAAASAIRATLAAAALAISLAGCSGGDPAVNTGPFGGAGYGGQALCSDPLAPHAVYTAGSELAFRNDGPAAVIDKVSFTRIHGLRLVAAYTVPNMGTGGGYGNRIGYPPPQRDLPTGVLWSERQRADGAHIPATPPKRAQVDLVLVIQLTSSTGTYRGIDIYYHTADGR